MRYYGKSLTPEGMQHLRGTLSMTLLIRRASRLFIFISNLYNVSIKLKKISNKKEGISSLISRQSRALVETTDCIVIETLEIFEQLFWTIFFVLDTYIGFVRLGVISVEEPQLLEMMENVYFPLWFAPDFCVFWKTLLRLYYNDKQSELVEGELKSLRDRDSLSQLGAGNESRTISQRLVEKKAQLIADRQRFWWMLVKVCIISTAFFNSLTRYKFYVSMCQSLLDMGVSSSFVPRTGVKSVLGEGLVGAFGMASAVMAIVDETSKK